MTDPDRAFNDDPKTGSIKLPRNLMWMVLAASIGAGGSAGLGGFLGGGDTKTAEQMAADVREIKNELKAMGERFGDGNLRFLGIDRDIAEIRKDVADIRKLTERRR